MRIYLDTSSLSRPFDDQAQERIRMEAEAVKLILLRCARGEWQHVSSEMAIIEIEANPDREKRRKVRALVPGAAAIIANTEAIFRRAETLEKLGFAAADAVHLAAAETQKADVMLTCDDRLLRVARRSRVTLKIANPVDWLREQEHARDT